MEALARVITAVHVATDRVKSYLPDSCFEGSGGPFKRPEGYPQDQTEMSAYRYPDQNGPSQQAQYGDVPEGETQFNASGGGVDEHGVPKETIDEWQAGWNVTNAIQVSF